MKAGIVGFGGVGKTTLFNILTDSRAETSRFGTSGRAEPNIGMARIPDARLDALAALFSPRKTTPATIEYVDLVGIRKTDAESDLFLSDLRNADVLLHVVRAFEDDNLPHPEGSIDPARDIGTLETALLLGDHAVAEKRVEKLRGSVAKTGRAEERRELEVLQGVLAAIEFGRPARELAWSAEEMRLLRGFAFLSGKPILHVVNLGEDDVRDLGGFIDRFALAEVAARPRTALLPLSARIEQEIAELSPQDAAVFQADLGLAEPCRARVLRATHEMMGLIAFFTVGADECRAWSIPAATVARRAAGAIHSDIERGFIRAEVIGAADLLALGGLAAARDKGLLRLEGKDYLVQDGDVINFRFSV
jgi:ribosome-binding ATPase